VIDLLVAHGINKDGDGYLIHVSWAGSGAEADTWEPADVLQPGMPTAYERRKNMAVGGFSCAPSISE
jgi:hypothetical protein